MADDQVMTQTAPYPAELARLVSCVKYRPGYEMQLRDLDRGQGSAGLTLIVRATVPDSYDTSTMITVAHYFPVPPAAYLAASWRRWLLDQLQLVDRHEGCELFREAGEHGEEFRPFAPLHGPGQDPYRITELSTDDERRTRFTGEISGGRP
jgi:hypothetical protein